MPNSSNVNALSSTFFKLCTLSLAGNNLYYIKPANTNELAMCFLYRRWPELCGDRNKGLQSQAHVPKKNSAIPLNNEQRQR